MRLMLPYGSRGYPIELPDAASVEILAPAALPAPSGSVEDLLDAALAAPIGSRGLSELAADARRVTLIVSDATRAEPRAALIEAVLRALPPRADRTLTLAIATGTHGPVGANLAELGIPGALLACFATIVDHDGHHTPPTHLAELGTTPRGTPVRVHRCLVDTDLVIATGAIRPHYFAGFGAGSKALFPGLGETTAIRINHALKTEPNARAGIVEGNPCREDLADAARLIPTPTFLLDVVCDPDDQIQHAVAGDLHDAFHAATTRARPWFEVATPPASLVIASDGLPITATLYQAAKIAAAAAPFVAPGGTLVIVAECADGIGPVETVNEKIFRIGILPRLPPNTRLVLVSELGEHATRRTVLEYADSLATIVRGHPPTERILVLPHASKLIARRPHQP